MGLVQGYTGSMASGSSVVLDFPTTSGNFLSVGATKWASGRPTLTVTDDKGNTFGQSLSVDYDSDKRLRAVYAYNIIGGSSHRITITDTSGTGGANISFAIQEHDNILTTDPLDKVASTTGTGTTPNSGATATLAQAVELVIAYLALIANAINETVFTPDSPYIRVGNRPYAALPQADPEYADAYKYVNATTAVTGGWTIEESQAYAAGVATFLALAPPSGRTRADFRNFPKAIMRRLAR